MSRATTKNTALDGRQPIVKQKFRLRQLRGAGASRRWCRILPRLVQPLRAICVSRSEAELFALPGLKFPVDSVSIPRRAQVIMSSSCRPGKEVATSSKKKRS
ncbi:hypothetical protein KY290_000763 [Solanum tuberosum]|uniref:Uncharacterized protein n=1 Tax=Solanum tuberosum TaxID=4113 RepID=A0ABQ7WKA7_SOLTU|nr:hypothetical protein KY290_000763 [Solanum tuberosum]